MSAAALQQAGGGGGGEAVNDDDDDDVELLEVNEQEADGVASPMSVLLAELSQVATPPLG